MTQEQIQERHQVLKEELRKTKELAGYLLERGTNAYYAFYADEVKALSDFEEEHGLKQGRLF